MPWLDLPESDKERRLLLIKVKTKTEQDALIGIKYILDETLLGITAFIPIFEGAYFLIDEKMEDRMKQTAEQTAAFKVLGVLSNDLMHVVRRRIYRDQEPVSLFGLYQMNQQGDIPVTTTMNEKLDLADSLIRGDAQAVIDGNPEMINPSAAQVQTALNTARIEFDEVAQADTLLDNAQETLAEHRKTADEWIKEIVDELVFGLRKKDSSSVRRIMRTYGFKYEYSPGEPQPPAKCLNFIHQFDDPNLTLTCDAVATATNYEMVYTIDDINWLPLYSGVDPTYTYAPPVGRRTYKIRAENEYGFGEWSDPVEFTVTEVPE